MSKLDELEKKVSEIERLCRELSDKRFLEDIHDELCENLKKTSRFQRITLHQGNRFENRRWKSEDD
jgi:hypothetical protein